MGAVVAQLDVEVFAVVRPEHSGDARVEAIQTDTNPRNAATVSWWSTPDGAPKVGTKLSVEIREA